MEVAWLPPLNKAILACMRLKLYVSGSEDRIETKDFRNDVNN